MTLLLLFNYIYEQEQGERDVYKSGNRTNLEAQDKINKAKGRGTYGNVPRSNYSAKHR
jgi:hypothetical protein